MDELNNHTLYMDYNQYLNYTYMELYNNSQHGIMFTSTPVRALFCFEYILIFVMGIFGNCLVCYVVFKNHHMQTVTNYFITNLALADILLCVLAVPFTPLYFFMKYWAFGSVLCHTVSMAQGVSVYVSSLTLTSIAVDRYFVILYPFRPRLRLIACYFIIIFIWFFSISATLPYALYMDLIEFKGNYYCEEQWPSEMIRRIFSSFTAIMQFVIPFIIILYCYIKISIRMTERARSKPGSKSRRRDEMDCERKRRMNWMLIAMVTIFCVSFFPWNVMNLINDYYVNASLWPYYNVCFFISHVVAMSSTCYNPFLYAWLNEIFRKEFIVVLPCFKKQNIENGSISVKRELQKSLREENNTLNNCHDADDATNQSAVHNPPVIEKGTIVTNDSFKSAESSEQQNLISMEMTEIQVNSTNRNGDATEIV